jgi:polyferredoxin
LSPRSNGSAGRGGSQGSGGAESGGGAQDPDGHGVPTPQAMLLVVVVLGVQSLALVGSAVSFFITAIGAGQLATSLIGLGVMFLIFAAGIAAAARGAWRLHRWARPASIAFELLVIVFGISVIGGSLWLGLACLITAIAVIMGFFLPPVVDAYNRALAD